VCPRGRLGFLAACVLVFAVIGVWVTRTTPSMAPSGKPPPTAALAPGAARPAGLTVTDLKDAGQLQARFNGDRGRAAAAAGAGTHLRRVPCGRQVGGHQHPSTVRRRPAAGVRGVGAAWALDTRAEVDGAGMADPRVSHYWDAGGVIGQSFLDRFGVDFGDLDYDFFLLSDRAATWGSDFPRPVSSGAPVIANSELLADGAAALLR
jgi:hypothetical protein